MHLLHSRVSLFTVVISWKVAVNTEFTNTEPLLPGEMQG